MNISEIRKDLVIDCQKCCGLCCITFCCMKSDGFPEDKAAGEPCTHLSKDDTCDIHANLQQKGLHGCIRYDCLGAGQRVTNDLYSGKSWRELDRKTMMNSFLLVHKMHTIVWYLLEAYECLRDEGIREDIEDMIALYIAVEEVGIVDIHTFDIDEYQENANCILKKVRQMICLKYNQKENAKKDYVGVDMHTIVMCGTDLTMSYLMAANFHGMNLEGVNFLGADMRDVDIRDADAHNSMFLTQMQLNTCKGNKNTKIPYYLKRPEHWED